MQLNLPNCLTVFRIIAIPLIVVIYLFDLRFGHWYCLILFALAGISDALDGYLARKLNQTSKMGAFLDPVADKLLVVTMLVLVATNPDVIKQVWSKIIFIPTVLVIIGREITVSALREWMAEIGQRATVAVSNVGKFKTGFQMGAIGCLLFKDDFIGLPILHIGEVSLYVASILTIWSMVIYLKAAYRTVSTSG